jgi:hypothetical protein
MKLAALDGPQATICRGELPKSSRADVLAGKPGAVEIKLEGASLPLLAMQGACGQYIAAMHHSRTDADSLGHQ